MERRCVRVIYIEDWRAPLALCEVVKQYDLALSESDGLTFFFVKHHVGNAVLYEKFFFRHWTRQQALHQMHVKENMIQRIEKTLIIGNIFGQGCR